MHNLPSKHETDVRFEMSDWLGRAEEDWMYDGSEVIPGESESLEIVQQRSCVRTYGRHHDASRAPMAGKLPNLALLRAACFRLVLQRSDQPRTHGPTGGHEMFEVARWWKHSGFGVPLGLRCESFPCPLFSLQDCCADTLCHRQAQLSPTAGNDTGVYR